jgi:plastocyanin
MMIWFAETAAGAMALTVLSLASSSFAAGPRLHVIVIDKLAFGPSPDDLHVNDAVEWKNLDILRHTATAADGSFDIDLSAGATGRTILRREGAVDYFCRFHPGMTGQLRIAR